MLPVSLWGTEGYGCKARLWGLVAELRVSRLQAATKAVGVGSKDLLAQRVTGSRSYEEGQGI